MINLKKNRSYYKKRSRKIKQQQENWQIERINLKRENSIKNDYNKIQNKNPFKITTGKLAMWILLFLCLIVIVFTGWVTIKEFSLAYALGVMPDFTPLVTMIGAILGAAIDVAAYFAKSAKENTKGGITYQAAAMKNFEQNLQPNGMQDDFLEEIKI